MVIQRQWRGSNQSTESSSVHHTSSSEDSNSSWQTLSNSTTSSLHRNGSSNTIASTSVSPTIWFPIAMNLISAPMFSSVHTHTHAHTENSSFGYGRQCVESPENPIQWSDVNATKHRWNRWIFNGIDAIECANIVRQRNRNDCTEIRRGKNGMWLDEPDPLFPLKWFAFIQNRHTSSRHSEMSEKILTKRALRTITWVFWCHRCYGKQLIVLIRVHFSCRKSAVIYWKTRNNSTVRTQRWRQWEKPNRPSQLQSNRSTIRLTTNRCISTKR